MAKRKMGEKASSLRRANLGESLLLVRLRVEGRESGKSTTQGKDVNTKGGEGGS